MSTQAVVSHRQIGSVGSTTSVADFSRPMILVLKFCCCVILLTKHVGISCPLITISAVNHELIVIVSSEGVLDFVEELRVRESDWEVADKCVVWRVLRHDQIKIWPIVRQQLAIMVPTLWQRW